MIVSLRAEDDESWTSIRPRTVVVKRSVEILVEFYETDRNPSRVGGRISIKDAHGVRLCHPLVLSISEVLDELLGRRSS